MRSRGRKNRAIPPAIEIVASVSQGTQDCKNPRASHRPAVAKKTTITPSSPTLIGPRLPVSTLNKSPASSTAFPLMRNANFVRTNQASPSKIKTGVNATGFYEEILNSDSSTYGGSNVGNYGGVNACVNWSWQNQPHSIEINLPPLSVVAFKHIPPVPQLANKNSK